MGNNSGTVSNDDTNLTHNGDTNANSKSSRSVFGSGHRYITNSDAIEILGGGNWKALMDKLLAAQVSNDQGKVDFPLFANIIRSRFEGMVRLQ